MMNALNEFIRLFDLYLIKGIFISVIVIILARTVFKEKIDAFYAARLIVWTIIIGSVLSLLSIILTPIFSRDEMEFYKFANRAFGPYWWYFWFLVITKCFLPLALFSTKLGKRLYLLLVVTFLVNIGWLFESYVIHMTNLHRVYIPVKYPYLPYPGEIHAIINGLLLGIIALIIGNTITLFVLKSSAPKQECKLRT